MKTHSFARMTALVAVLALGLGASPAEALKLYSQSGSSCQPYWQPNCSDSH